MISPFFANIIVLICFIQFHCLQYLLPLFLELSFLLKVLFRKSSNSIDLENPLSTPLTSSQTCEKPFTSQVSHVTTSEIDTEITL